VKNTAIIMTSGSRLPRTRTLPAAPHAHAAGDRARPDAPGAGQPGQQRRAGRRHRPRGQRRGVEAELRVHVLQRQDQHHGRDHGQLADFQVAVAHRDHAALDEEGEDRPDVEGGQDLDQHGRLRQWVEWEPLCQCRRRSRAPCDEVPDGGARCGAARVFTHLYGR
jgi:hypothetical protein